MTEDVKTLEQKVKEGLDRNKCRAQGSTLFEINLSSAERLLENLYKKQRQILKRNNSFISRVLYHLGLYDPRKDYLKSLEDLKVQKVELEAILKEEKSKQYDLLAELKEWDELFLNSSILLNGKLKWVDHYQNEIQNNPEVLQEPYKCLVFSKSSGRRRQAEISLQTYLVQLEAEVAEKDSINREAAAKVMSLRNVLQVNIHLIRFLVDQKIRVEQYILMFESYLTTLDNTDGPTGLLELTLDAGRSYLNLKKFVQVDDKHFAGDVRAMYDLVRLPEDEGFVADNGNQFNHELIKSKLHERKKRVMNYGVLPT